MKTNNDPTTINKLLSHFYHDMHNSLGSNQKLIEIFVESVEPKLEENEVRWLNQIEIENQQALRKLKGLRRYLDLLNYSDELLPVQLDLFVNSWTRKNFDSINIKTDIKRETTVCSTEYLLDKLFTCLIENSIEHSQKDRQELSIRIEQSITKNNLILKISDNGCGIANDKLQTIIEPFRGDTDKTDSLGLGLNYVDLIMRKNDGEFCLRNLPEDDNKSGLNGSTSGCVAILTFPLVS